MLECGIIPDVRVQTGLYTSTAALGVVSPTYIIALTVRRGDIRGSERETVGGNGGYINISANKEQWRTGSELILVFTPTFPAVGNANARK
jgi:hypothetical protein